MIKMITVLALSSLAIGLSGTPGCRGKINNGSPVMEDQKSGDLKVLAEGFHYANTNPFVAVVRDKETYDALRQHDASLPKVDAEFFKSNIVIAAFLGERNTGGYSVEISREAAGQIRVAEKAPGKGMMVPQVITSPFKVVSMPTTGTPAVSLSLGEAFQQRGQLYRISSGTFTVSGGFAGRTETFQLAGKLQITRIANLVTVGFAIVSRGTTRERMLRDIATGLVTENAISISRLSHGSLLDTPSGDLHVKGTFIEKNRVNLDFDSGPVTVPDGYSGKGSIEAEMVTGSAN